MRSFNYIQVCRLVDKFECVGERSSVGSKEDYSGRRHYIVLATCRWEACLLPRHWTLKSGTKHYL